MVKANLVLKLLWIPVSILFWFGLLSTISISFNEILYYFNGENYDGYISYQTREHLVIGVLFVLVVAYFTLELAAHRSEITWHSRTLTNLRFGSLAIWIFAILIIISFDSIMIEVSRHRIRNYVYSEFSSSDPPDLSLHNNYRGWCGNGASAAFEDLYYPTASAGLSDSDQYVRTRAFLASSRVRDFLNGSEKFKTDTVRACRDTSEIVRNTASRYLANGNSSCEKVVSSYETLSK